MTTPQTPGEQNCCTNTDKELWREREGDYYADSIHVTEHGGIGINCGGTVHVKTLRAWHKLAGGVYRAPAPQPEQTSKGLIHLNESQQDLVKKWSADSDLGDLWGNDEARAFNLTTFARAIIVAASSHQPTTDETEIARAAEHMDWVQVVLNGGPPCFHLDEDGSFCGRAERWDGHEDLHSFVSLANLIARHSAEQTSKPKQSHEWASKYYDEDQPATDDETEIAREAAEECAKCASGHVRVSWINDYYEGYDDEAAAKEFAQIIQTALARHSAARDARIRRLEGELDRRDEAVAQAELAEQNFNLTNINQEAAGETPALPRKP